MATRRDMVAMIAGVLAGLPASARASDAAPRVAFNPALGVAQAFRVSYRLRDRPAADAAQDRFVIEYRLTVTPLVRNADGWRLRLLVGAVEQGAAGASPAGMNMAVAGALMLDGLPIEMQVDGRGQLSYVVGWPALQRTLMERAGARLGAFASVGRSVAGNDAEQVAWHLARGLDAMSFARAYLDRAQRLGAQAVSWFGTPVDLTVTRDGDGSLAVAWVRPAGPSAQANDEGRAIFRRDGFVSQLTRTSAPPGGGDSPQREIVAVEALAM